MSEQHTAPIGADHAEPARRSGPLAPGSSPWALFLGLYALTLVAQFTSLAFGRSQLQQGLSSMLLPSLANLSLLTLPAIWVGLRLGPSLGLGAPRFAALLARRQGSVRALFRDVAVAGIAGLLLGAAFLALRFAVQPLLPAALPEPGFRGVLGGAAVSLGFGLAHVPQMVAYGVTAPAAVASTVLGNVAVGILYGWCYWRRGLLAAMIAHFSVDIVLHSLPALVA